MKLQSIQVLRGIAAMLVVIYHTRALEGLGILSNGGTERPLVGGLFTNGYAGVDLFFVISGFIMVYVTNGVDNTRHNAADFLFARLTRVYPLWWVFATIMVVYLMLTHGIIWSGPDGAVTTRGQPLWSFLFKSYALAPQASYPVLAVGWTLIHEIYFYVAFALILLLPRARWMFVLLGWGVAIAIGSMLGWSGAIATSLPSLIFHPMTMEFIFGALVGLAVMSGFAWRGGVVTLVATLWLMASLCLQGVETPATLHWGRILWFGFPCTLLIYGVVTLELTDRRAWLVPAAIGALVCTLAYACYGLLDSSPFDARLGAMIVSVSVGAIAMLITLWVGWLGGQAMPERLRDLTPHLERIYAGLARFGDWSFSLYLLHVIVLGGVKLALGVLGKVSLLAPLFALGHPGRLDNLLFILVGTGFCIFAASLVYRHIERPMIIFFGNLRERLFYQRPAGDLPD